MRYMVANERIAASWSAGGQLRYRLHDFINWLTPIIIIVFLLLFIILILEMYSRYFDLVNIKHLLVIKHPASQDSSNSFQV
jgi:hypothetical protein